jgi:hypothetical protein
MNNLLHFAKIFGIGGATAMVVYLAVIYRWGFAVGLHFGSFRPPTWAVQALFWLWPLVPVFFVVIVWELIRVAVLRKA